jgi:hypothetical protein
MSLKPLSKEEKTIRECKRLIEANGNCLSIIQTRASYECEVCPCAHAFRIEKNIYCGSSSSMTDCEERVKICKETLAKLEASSPEPFNEIKMTLIDSTIKQVRSCIAEALKHLDQLENMK